MNISNRRKVCELEIQKQAYLRHISRLEQLKFGRSPEQLRRNREQKKLAYTINIVRKIHNNNRQFRQKGMRQVEQESKEIDFGKVKSVITQDFNWPIPSIAPKHRRNEQPIVDQNLKMFERIVLTKPNVSSQNLDYTDRKNKEKYLGRPGNKSPLPCISSDFSKLYESSLLNEAKPRVLRMKLGKCKKYVKAGLQIDCGELLEVVKDHDSMYLMQVCFGDLLDRSQGFILGELQAAKVVIKIGQKDLRKGRLTIRIIKILDSYEKKQMCKARLYADIDDQLFRSNKENEESYFYSTNQSPVSTRKEQNDCKNRTCKQDKKRKSPQKISIALSLEKEPKALTVGFAKTGRTTLGQQKQNLDQSGCEKGREDQSIHDLKAKSSKQH